MTFSHFLQEQCVSALKSAFSERDIPSLDIAEADPKFGHYQLNSAMKLSKLWGMPPRDIANQVKGVLEKQPQYFEKVEVAGPGFINLTLNRAFIADQIWMQLHDPKLGIETPTPLKVIIDFSSPNIAKEMHVGHLRSTIIGDALARILAFQGHEVLRLNHVGDWGTQFGMLIAYLKSQPTQKNRDLSDLMKAYQAAKLRFDEDEAFKKEAQLSVVSLQSGDMESKALWEQICQISREAYQTIYDLLDVQIIERGESFYNPWLTPLIEELKKAGQTTVSEGALCIDLPGFENREGQPLPLILQKSDGGFNYATTDLAALKHRTQVEKGQWLIYVTDAGQQQHFKMVFAAGKKIGILPDTTRVDHVPFGLVLKADGKKFQTRSGQTERLIDLLNTAIEKAKDKLLEHNPDLSQEELTLAAQILGINAIKYADLSCHRLSDYIFNYDKMLKWEGNTAAFLLYAYVRIKSIQRKVGINSEVLLKEPSKLVLEDPSEIALGLLLCQFPDMIERASEELLPNRLTDYLFRVAEYFHSFFHQCRVEGSDQQTSRLILCEATARVLLTGFQLLGLKPLERM